MSDEIPANEITINVKGPSELKLQIIITTDKTVLELKQAIAEKSEVEAERQRLIYSGRVLKDEDVLSSYKIQTSHTIHMVKGAVRSGPSTQAAAAPQQLPTMQAGQNPLDPLTQLNSHMGYGAMAGLNPFADMGLNANDPNMMQSMMNSPQFFEQMSAMMSNPQVMDQIIASNPQLAAMAPQVRQAFQSEHFREMISNPQRLQQLIQMSSMLREAGGSPFGPPQLGFGPGVTPGGGLFGGPAGGFPAPGMPGGDSSAAARSPTGTPGATGTTPAAQPFNMFAGLGGAGAGAGAGTGGAVPPTNPFPTLDPALMQQMMGMGNLFGGFGGVPSTPQQTDTRSPEERFQVQLQQLQDMGFSNASQNVRALLATGGNVHTAIEYILGGGGL